MIMHLQFLLNFYFKADHINSLFCISSDTQHDKMKHDNTKVTLIMFSTEL